MDAEQKKPVVLLTGANGFLGTRFCRELVDKGYHVIATGTKEQSSQANPDITYVRVDLSDAKTHKPEFWDDLFQKHAIDSVIHNAGIIEENRKRNQTFENVNVLSTVALADAAAAHPVNKFIFISTIGASHSYAHKYGYPGSKQKAEQYLQGRDDLNWTIVRPDIVYSEKSWGHSFSFDELSGLRIVPIIGDGKQKLQPIHIDDIAQTVNLLSNGKANRETLNACGSEAIEIREILQFLREKRERKFRTISLSVAFAEAVAKNYPIGVLNPSFVGMLREAMENPGPKIDATPFMQAVGLEKLITLREAYEHVDPATMGRPNTMGMVKQVVWKPLRLFSLTAEFARAAVNRTSAPNNPAVTLDIRPESMKLDREALDKKETGQTPKLPTPDL